jgi:hypothetical protein
VNLVFYNGRTPFTGTIDFKDLFNASKELVDAVWGKPLTLIDVHTVSDEVMNAHERAGILTFFMKNIWTRDFLPYLKEIMQKLRTLEQQGDTDFVISLLHYALSKGETTNVDAFIEIVKQGLSETTGEEIMTMAQQLLERGKQYGLEQGIKQGIEQGLQQGLKQGAYSVLLRLIERKFHRVPEIYRKKMEKADAKTLLEWVDRVLDAEDLDDIFNDKQ